VVEREVVRTTTTGVNAAATAQCNPGEVVTGGGWVFVSGSITNFLNFGDWPVKADGKDAASGDTPHGSRVAIFNASGQTATWRVYVLCASP